MRRNVQTVIIKGNKQYTYEINTKKIIIKISLRHLMINPNNIKSA